MTLAQRRQPGLGAAVKDHHHQTCALVMAQGRQRPMSDRGRWPANCRGQGFLPWLAEREGFAAHRRAVDQITEIPPKKATAFRCNLMRRKLLIDSD